MGKKKNQIKNIDLNHFGYNMMMTAFSSRDINVGLKKALLLANIVLESSDIILYKKDIYDIYNMYTKVSPIKSDNTWLNMFVNKCENLLDGQEPLYVGCSDISSDHDITLIPITTYTNNYLLVIKNCNQNIIDEDKEVLGLLADTIQTILDNLEQFNELNIDGRKDRLTGLDNRNEYERVIKELNKSDTRFVYILLDLFRLKYLNDNYDYLLGDAYIIKTADILKKYFPKYRTYKDEYGIMNKEETGTCVYRIGGDEFVIICRNEEIEDIKYKLEGIEEEVKSLDLNTKDPLLLGINYGLAIRENSETIKDLTLSADEELKTSKTLMYRKYGLERRR